jgi:MIP family channel proteins
MDLRIRDEREKEQERPPIKLKAIPMEMLGTFALVYFGGLSYVLKDMQKMSVTGVALTHGFIYTIFVWMGDHVSGGYYNPVLTVGDIFTGKLNMVSAAYLICSQIIGSFGAAAYLCFVLDQNILREISNKSVLGFPNVNKTLKFGNGGAFISEFIGSFFLQFVALMVRNQKPFRKDYYAFCIGGIMTAALVAVGDISGGALNPARVVGPMFLTNNADSDQWIFWIGPFFGAIVASLFYQSFFAPEEKEEAKKRRIRKFY